MTRLLGLVAAIFLSLTSVAVAQGCDDEPPPQPVKTGEKPST